MTTAELVKEYRGAVYRISSTNSLNPGPETGTGFIFRTTSDRAYLFTCLHVVLTKDLNQVAVTISADGGQANKAGYRAYFKKYITHLKVESATKKGFRVAYLEDFDPQHDLAVLSLRYSEKPKTLKLDPGTKADLGSEVAFLGFPLAPDYQKEKLPFAVSEGVVSSYLKAAFGVPKPFEHLQINAATMGGNSGGPVFDRDTGLVVGMIRAQMNTSINAPNLAMFNPADMTQLIPNNLVAQIPMAVAYSIPGPRLTNLARAVQKKG